MLKIDLDKYKIPETIKNHLKAQCNTIDIDRISIKGANGHLFFGFNPILRKRVALKYYYWGSDDGLHAEPDCVQSCSQFDLGRPPALYAFYAAACNRARHRSIDSALI
jgi:hypothetical protein